MDECRSGNSSSLLRLGKYILTVVFEWMKPHSLVDLDTAICNKRDRLAYMSWFRESHWKLQQALFPIDKPIPLDYNLVDWAFDRGMDVDAFKSIEITSISLLNGVGDVSFFKSYLRNMLCLKFDRCSVFGTVLLPDILCHCRSLEELHITNTMHNIGNAVLEAGVTCKNLKVCNFSSCNNLPEVAFLFLSQNCSKLEEINIYFCNKLSSASILSIAVNCRKLRCFHIDGSLEMTLRDAAIFALHCRPHSLSQFSRHLWTNYSIRWFLAYQGGGLLDLNISHLSKRIADETVSPIGQSCPQLQSLNLSGFMTVTQDGLTPIIHALPGLKSLSIGRLDIDPVTMRLLVDRCTGLTHLRMDSRNVSAAVVAQCITSSSVRNTLVKLFLVKMNVTDDDLLLLTASCTALKELEMHENNSVTDDGVVNAARHMKQYQKLVLAGCRQLTDQSLMSIAQHCYNLTELSVRDSRAVSNEGVIAVVQQCRELQHLNIRTSKQASDVFIDALCDLNRTHLVTLNIHWCTLITVEGLCKLIRRAKKLRNVLTKLHLPPLYFVDYPDVVVEEDYD